MAFDTTGKSHKNGLKGEKFTKSLIENNCTKFFGSAPSVLRRGGTKYKEDLLINNTTKLSCKNRANKSGTFDYCNSSNILKFLDSKEALKLNNFVKSKRHAYKGQAHNKETLKPVMETVRRDFNDLSKNALFSLSSLKIEKIVRDGLKDYVEDTNFYFSITHHPRKELLIFPASELPLVKFLKKEESLKFSLAQTKGKTSARILIQDSAGNVHDFGLRLRLVLNNGIGALLAGKDVSSNDNSQVVVKLQQDEPDKQINNVSPQLMETIKF